MVRRRYAVPRKSESAWKMMQKCGVLCEKGRRLRLSCTFAASGWKCLGWWAEGRPCTTAGTPGRAKSAIQLLTACTQSAFSEKFQDSNFISGFINEQLSFIYIVCSHLHRIWGPSETFLGEFWQNSTNCSLMMENQSFQHGKCKTQQSWAPCKRFQFTSQDFNHFLSRSWNFKAHTKQQHSC